MCFTRMPSSFGPAQRLSIDYRRYQRLRPLKSIVRQIFRSLHYQHNRSPSSVLETAEDLCGLLTPAPFGFCSSISQSSPKPYTKLSPTCPAPIESWYILPQLLPCRDQLVDWSSQPRKHLLKLPNSIDHISLPYRTLPSRPSTKCNKSQN